MAGLTEANSDWGSHSIRKKGGYTPPSISLPFSGSQRGNQISQEHVVNLRKEGLCGTTRWELTILNSMNADKITRNTENIERFVSF